MILTLLEFSVYTVRHYFLNCYIIFLLWLYSYPYVFTHTPIDEYLIRF